MGEDVGWGDAEKAKQLIVDAIQLRAASLPPLTRRLHPPRPPQRTGKGSRVGKCARP